MGVVESTSQSHASQAAGYGERMNPWLTADEAAELLGVGRPHIYKLIQRGQLLSRRFGRSLRISALSVGRRLATNPGPGQPRKDNR